MEILLPIVTFLIVAAVLLAVFALTGKRQDRNYTLYQSRLEAIQQAAQRGNVSQELQVLRDELLSITRE
jgi:hypothetical protein